MYTEFSHSFRALYTEFSHWFHDLAAAPAPAPAPAAVTAAASAPAPAAGVTASAAAPAAASCYVGSDIYNRLTMVILDCLFRHCYLQQTDYGGT